MSLCHIWFGVERSNRRGGGFGLRRGLGGRAVNPVALRCSLTVEGLALRQKNRRRICEMLFAPCRGSSRLSSVIFARTAAGRRAAGLLPLPSTSPASPSSWYRPDQCQTTLSLMPSSLAISFAGSPSSRYSCTARRRISTGYGRGR
jgi:hypothetical protein